MPTSPNGSEKLQATMPHGAALPEQEPPLLPPSRRRTVFVHAMSWVIVVMVLLMLTSVYWRWATVHEPSTALIFRGDASLDGAVITISGQDHSWKATLDRDNVYQTPVLLGPGLYHVTVTHRGQTIESGDWEASHNPMTLELPRAIRLAGPSDQGTIDVKIAGQRNEPVEAKLDVENHFHSIVYLRPDEYRATFWHGAHIIARQDFTVDGANDTRIDATKPTNKDGMAVE